MQADSRRPTPADWLQNWNHFRCVTFNGSASFRFGRRKHTFPGPQRTRWGLFDLERASDVMRRFLASGFHPQGGRSRKKTSGLAAPVCAPRTGAVLILRRTAGLPLRWRSFQRRINAFAWRVRFLVGWIVCKWMDCLRRCGFMPGGLGTKLRFQRHLLKLGKRMRKRSGFQANQAPIRELHRWSLSRHCRERHQRPRRHSARLCLQVKMAAFR